MEVNGAHYSTKVGHHNVNGRLVTYHTKVVDIASAASSTA